MAKQAKNMRAGEGGKTLVVKNDTRKLLAISVSYALIGACLVGLSLSSYSNPVLVVFAALIAIVLVFAIAKNVSRMRDVSPLFTFTEQGVTDYTKPDDVMTLPWDHVLSVSLKAANSNDLMLDVMGYRSIDELEMITPEMQAQLDQNGGDCVYYLLELSGLWVRRSCVQGAYDWVRENVGPAYPQIVFSKFKDPLSKLGKKKGELEAEEAEEAADRMAAARAAAEAMGVDAEDGSENASAK